MVKLTFSLENRDFLGFQMIFNVRLNQIISIDLFFKLLVNRYLVINIERRKNRTAYSYKDFVLYYQVLQTLLVICYQDKILENSDFQGFRMVFKVRLNQIFSNFNTMRCTIKYRLSSIMVKLTFTVQVYSIVLKFEKIWLSGTLNIIRNPKKYQFSKRKRAITQEQ
jgi:hypothetical protein